MSPIIVEREKSYAVITVLSFIKDNINQGLEAKNIYFRVFLAIKINILKLVAEVKHLHWTLN